MIQPEAIHGEQGGELAVSDLLEVGKVAGVGLAGGAAGLLLTGQLTKEQPVPVDLSPDYPAEASFTKSPGLRITNHGKMIYYQDVDADPHIPSLNGVKINVINPDLSAVAQDAIAHPHRQSKLEKQLIAIVSQRDGTKQKVADSLTGAVVDGGTTLGLTAAATAAAIKIWKPRQKFSNMMNRIKSPIQRSALRFGTVALAAGSMAIGMYETANLATKSEDRGRPLPAELASKTPFLSDPRVSGDDLLRLIDRAQRLSDQGLREWSVTNRRVNTAVGKYELSNPKLGSTADEQTVFAATGILCNTGFDQTVLQSLQWRIPHEVNTLGGDTFLTGHRWSFENNCLRMVAKHMVGKNNVSALQNHDGKPTPWDISNEDDYARKVDGTYFVSVPDPRDMMGDKNAIPPTGEKLKFAIAKAGSIAAERACEIKDKTGRPPLEIVGTPEMGFESILRDCVVSVTSDHYLFSRSPKLPTLRNIRAGDNVVHQFVYPSASGSKTNYEPYKGPQKPAGVGLQNYSRDTGELVSAQAVVYGPGLKAKVLEQDTTTTTSPNRALFNFVMNYSPTADKVQFESDP